MKFFEMLERNPKNYKKAWEQYKDGILLFFSFLSLAPICWQTSFRHQISPFLIPKSVDSSHVTVRMPDTQRRLRHYLRMGSNRSSAGNVKDHTINYYKPS